MPTPRGRGDHRIGVSRRRARSRAEKRCIRTTRESVPEHRRAGHEKKGEGSVESQQQMVELPSTLELLSTRRMYCCSIQTFVMISPKS
jgi:hypothetical protein